MLRHYRATHGYEELADTRESTPVPNKQAVDEAVVNMIIKDCQPLSFVENEGFRELLKLILPSYALPSRKTIKDLVSQKYEEEKEKTKKDLQSAVAVTLTADMWTSMNMEAYLAMNSIHQSWQCSIFLRNTLQKTLPRLKGASWRSGA
ncbi:zinc finger BED domain-containing protein 4-like [Oryzias latipes]|uniref:zinc finger BED domain-containing protein 4-like n=1 Tax=Oryzias latipes TaxID=8090 RepID=UPI000CE1673C|nr:zinc finger BED domain-containing protein 4-like [Oryzias latipes]